MNVVPFQQPPHHPAHLADAARALAPWFEAGRIVVQPGDDCTDDELAACLRDLDAFFDALRADGGKGAAA